MSINSTYHNIYCSIPRCKNHHHQHEGVSDIVLLILIRIWQLLPVTGLGGCTWVNLNGLLHTIGELSSEHTDVLGGAEGNRITARAMCHVRSAEPIQVRSEMPLKLGIFLTDHIL